MGMNIMVQLNAGFAIQQILMKSDAGIVKGIESD